MYHWIYRKSLVGGALGFKPMSTTGPHKIYLSYDAPRLDTVNELGLKYICNYARNLYESINILKSGVYGIYKQQWSYKPDNTIFTKPLDMVRKKKPIGQCVDYANLLTYFTNSIGIPTNTTIIFNGRTDAFGFIEHYRWIYSILRSPTNILSNRLTACDNSNMNWAFSYHAVSNFNGMLGDPVFNLTFNESEYKQWWEYYLHPHPIGPPPYYFSGTHPPPIPPFYYDWGLFAIPDSVHLGVFPPNTIFIIPFDFWYP